MSMLNPLSPANILLHGNDPLGTVQPFTYRDGRTHALKLEELQYFISEYLVKAYNASVEQVKDVLTTLDDTIDGKTSIALADIQAMVADATVTLNTITDDVEGSLNTLIQQVLDNSIELQDTVAAGLVDGPSDTKQRLDSKYLAFRLWDGEAYAPADDEVKVFVGGPNPGPAASPDDLWTDPDVTTVAEVRSLILDQSSTLHQAIAQVSGSRYADIVFTGRDVDTLEAVAPSTVLSGHKLAKATAQQLVGFATIPYGWAVARLRYFIITQATGGGDLRIDVRGAAFRGDAGPREFAGIANTVVAPTTGLVKSVLHTNPFDVSNMDSAMVDIRRVTSSGADTFAGDIYVIGARLEKVS